MAYDINRMNEGFAFLLEKLPGAELVSLVDDPRFPPELLLNAIIANSRYPGQIAKALKHGVLTKIDDQDSLYSQLIDAAVISKYLENNSFRPYSHYEHSDKRHSFREMPPGYTQRLIAAATLLERWEAEPNERLTTTIINTLDSYRQLLETLPGAGMEAPLEPSLDETSGEKKKREELAKEREELVSARKNLNWDKIFTDMGEFIFAITGNAYLSQNFSILKTTQELLQTVEKDDGKNPIPEEIRARMMSLLNEQNIFHSTTEFRQKIDAIEATCKENPEGISVADFLESYKTVGDFLTQYGSVIPRLEMSRLRKEFARFSREAVENLAIDFANSENNQGMVEFCAVIAGNETIAHKFLSTLTANTKDMPKIVQAAAALTPHQG